MMTRRAIALIAAMMMAGCGKKDAPTTRDDTWASRPPVICPTVCAVWNLTWDAPKFNPNAISCLTDPDVPGQAGKLIANDPNNPRIVVVALNAGCDVGGFTTTK